MTIYLVGFPLLSVGREGERARGAGKIYYSCSVISCCTYKMEFHNLEGKKKKKEKVQRSLH